MIFFYILFIALFLYFINHMSQYEHLTPNNNSTSNNTSNSTSNNECACNYNMLNNTLTNLSNQVQKNKAAIDKINNLIDQLNQEANDTKQ